MTCKTYFVYYGMGHLHKKSKNKQTYFYYRIMKRVNGQPTVVFQKYLGTADTIMEKMAEAAEAKRPLKLQSKSFGALFVLDLLEKELDTIGIIDSIVPRGIRETGPTVGEYFYYAWVNRLVSPRSKRALEGWYEHTAVQDIRPVDLRELTSERYWDKWNQVDSDAVEAIGKAFFAKVWENQPVPAECLLFDTTNYYTFMNGKTKSELCQRGHNKAGRHNLRQVGLALLVDRETQLPMYYKGYEGNIHDSKLFGQIMDEMFDEMCRFNETKQRLTVVFDKGMNSEESFNVIDDNARIHFITTYSPYYVEELAGISLKKFSPLDLRKNRKRSAEDRITAWRCRHELWGKERTVVVTMNPRTARKKAFTFNQKLEAVRNTLIEYRRKYREQLPHWRKAESIQERYRRFCEKLHLSTRYYNLEFAGTEMSFRKDVYQVTRAEKLFGRNVIVTDNHDWTTEEIVQLSLDRNIIEKQFRSGKAKEHVRMNPMYHWTDSKIRCHLLTCAIALTVLRLLELRVNRNRSEENRLSGKTILDEMSNLNLVTLWHDMRTNPETILEDPTKTQKEVLKAFGYKIAPTGVLQQSSS